MSSFMQNLQIGFFMLNLFVIATALASKASSTGKAGLFLRQFRFLLGALSGAAGWYFATLYFASYAPSWPNSLLLFTIIAASPCALGVALTYWIEKPSSDPELSSVA